MAAIMLDTDGDTRLMTYAELAAARGITRRSATRLAFKEGWRRVPGNDGLTRVAVPMSALAPRETETHAGHGGERNGAGAFTAAIEALKTSHADTVVAMTATIAAQGQVIATVERELINTRTALDKAEARVTVLEGELTAERTKVRQEVKPDQTYRAEEIKSRASLLGSSSIGLFVTGTMVPVFLAMTQEKPPWEMSKGWWSATASAYALAMVIMKLRLRALDELKDSPPPRYWLWRRWRLRGGRVRPGRH